MDSILNDISAIIRNAVAEYLPEIDTKDLENDGEIFYMNGKNGTEFDWFVNEHLPSFMIFYNDDDNMGAAKADVYHDGVIRLYLYGERGKKMIKNIEIPLDVSEKELLRLAAALRNNADEKRIWDSAVSSIESDILPEEDIISEFLGNKKYYEASIRRKEIMGKLCVVSKKITRDGWKVGFMMREELQDDQDSGWQFFAGDEDDEYTDDIDNLELCVVNSIIGIDHKIMGYIDSPIGSVLVRTSDGKFEKDNGQKVFMEKWK